MIVDSKIEKRSKRKIYLNQNNIKKFFNSTFFRCTCTTGTVLHQIHTHTYTHTQNEHSQVFSSLVKFRQIQHIYDTEKIERKKVVKDAMRPLTTKEVRIRKLKTSNEWNQKEWPSWHRDDGQEMTTEAHLLPPPPRPAHSPSASRSRRSRTGTESLMSSSCRSLINGCGGIASSLISSLSTTPSSMLTLFSTTTTPSSTNTYPTTSSIHHRDHHISTNRIINNNNKSYYRKNNTTTSKIVPVIIVLLLVLILPSTNLLLVNALDTTTLLANYESGYNDTTITHAKNGNDLFC